MQKLGNVSDTEMFRTFNMGIGMILICAETDAKEISEQIGDCFTIGKVTGATGEQVKIS